MRNQLQLKPSYNRSIYKYLFVAFFIFSFSAAIGQEVIINKTAVANANACKQFDIELSITGNPTDSPQEVVLIIDRSGSMDDAPGSQNDPIDYAQDAAIDFVNQFFLPANNPTGKNKIALVTFNYSATVNVSLSGSANKTTIINSINAITTYGSTNTTDALNKARQELTTNGTFDCATSRSIILLSDGVANNGTNAIQAGVNAQTITVQGEDFSQKVFTIGLVGAISGSDQTNALNILDGIQNGGAFSTENNADLTAIYGSILGQLVSAAKQLPGQALVTDNIQAGFSVVPGTFIASKGNAMNVGQAVSWFVTDVSAETITLKYTIVADDDSVCGTLLPGTSVINYEDSSCEVQSVEFNNPSVCVPCPEITPVISMSGCSNTISYSSILTQNECPSSSDAYAWEFFLNGASIGTSNTESGIFEYTGNGLFQGDFIARLTYSGTYVSGCTLPDVEEQVSLVVQDILDINVVSQTDPECATDTSGEIIVEGLNGNPPYQYSIDNGVTFQNSGTFSNLDDGNYTIQVRDDAGCNITSVDITLTNGDDENPTWTNAPTDMTVECDGTLDPNGDFANWLSSFSGTDNSGNATVTHNSTGLSDLCGATGTETVTFTLSDDCGNSITADAVFTIVDTTDPIFNEALPSDVTVECDNIPVIETLTATDSCGTASVTFNEDRADGSCASEYVLTRTWTATDECGNTAIHIQTVTVEDNSAPTMTVDASNIVVECSVSGNYPDLDAWLNNNGGASASDTCGSVTWTNNYAGPTSDCATPVDVTFTATDECGNQTTTIASFAIQDNIAPTISIEASDLIEECDGSGNTSALQAWLDNKGGASATDNCSDISWTNDFVGLIDACGESQSATVTFTVSDGCGNSSSTTATFMIQDTTAPTFNEALPSEITEECDAITGPVTLTASDSCGDATVTFNEVRTDGSCDYNYTLLRTWTATDACGNTTEHTQTVNVQDNTGPTMNVQASDIIVECDGSGNNGAIDTWLNNNGGASASDSCGTVTWTNNYGGQTSDCATPISVIFTATDECGNQTTTSATYAIQDTNAPSITLQASDLIEECDGSGNVAALQAWLDNNGGATATDDCSAIAWTNDFTSLSDECGATGSATVTFTVTDGCGNASSTTATFTIEDNTAPTFNEVLPSDVSEECDAITNPVSLTASDSCGDATVTFDEVRTNGSCDTNYTLLRTWTATDACGNTTQHTQTVNVQDNTAPTFNENLPGDITLECDAITPAITLTATDNCGTANVIFDETRIDGSCASDYSITRTWTATDACGNSTVHTQTVIVQDNTAPIFNESLPADITQECDVVTPGVTLTATDNCGSANVTFEETRIDGACASDYILTRTWTATDDCGNATSHTQTVTIQSTPITFNIEATNMVLACDGAGNIAAMEAWLNSNGGATASNSCGNITWTHNYSGQAADCSTPISVTFTATDDCGNQTTTTASYSIQDAIAPIIEVEASDLTEECDGAGNATALQDWLDNNGGAIASDDCSAITWSNDYTGLSDDCGATGSATVTFTATDGCGNNSSTTATFRIEDTVNPTFNESLPSDVTIECDALTGSSITLTASDSCGDANVTFNEVRTDGSCPSSYTLARTWTATDACGNTTSHSQIVTVEDNTPPVFNETLPSDITVECDTLIGASVILTASDNCGDATVTFDEVRTEGSCPSNYILTRTWTASDDCGNTTSHSQIVTVEDTTAPVLENLPSDNGNETCDEPYKNPDFEDNSVNGYAYLNEDFIIGWNTTAENGVIEIQESGAVNNTDSFSGSFHAELNGDSASDIYQEFCTIPNAELEISFAHHKRMSGNNTTDDIVGVYIGTTPDNVQLLQTFTATSTSGWTQHNIDYVVPDGQTTTVILFKAEQGAPNNNTYGNLIDGAQVTDTTNLVIECDNIPEAANVTAVDNCDANVDVVLTETTVEGNCPGSYQLVRTWTATDNCGNSSEFVQTLTIQDVTPPTFVEDLPQNENYECSDVPEAATLTAVDNCTNATVTLTETQEEGDCPGALVITRIWVASDECNNQVTHTQVIRVQDTTPPEFNEELPVDVIVECGDIPNVPTLTVTDNCGDAMLEFNEETIDGDCPSNYTITRTWTATDDCDNTVVHIQTITVQDTSAPVVTSDYEEEISVSCSDIPEAPELEFEDACSSDITVSYEETSTQNASGNDYEIIREWTVSDACDNTAIYTQTVFVNADSNVSGTDTELCNGDDIRYDLFNLLTGDYGTDGVWTVSPSDVTIEDGHYFNPLGLDVGLYIFTYTDDVSQCPSETMVEIELNDECIVLPCGDANEVIISKAVTANGDNINDYFTIEGIEGCGFTVEVQIYNRWGAKIYESKNYQNDWNGISHGNSIGGSDKVPTGTYYYIINLVDSGLKPFAGPIYVGTK